MNVQTLPQDVAGSWIWLPDSRHLDNRKVMVRKTIIIEEEIASCELRICVIPFYHLFINGEHVGQGSAYPTEQHCYTDIYDISKLLGAGENIVAVSTLDLTAPTWNRGIHPAQFWCQILLNGRTVAATDESWQIAVNRNFSTAQPRCHFGRTRTERKKFSGSHSEWFPDSCEDARWEPAKTLRPFPEGKPVPLLTGLPPRLWNRSEVFSPAAAGAFEDLNAVTWYDYQAFADRPPGNYAAEAYAFSTEERDAEIRISTDDPYMVFCNQNLVAINQKSFASENCETRDSLQPGMELLESFSLHLKKGWNHFLCFQDLSASGSMGLMLMFPGVRKGNLQFRRECRNDVSCRGWTVCGPLRLPFSYSSPSMIQPDVRNVPAAVFVPEPENVNDVSAYLSICSFSIRPDFLPGELHQGDFLLYDLGHFHYGYPYLQLVGSPGDIIDVTCGLRTGENLLPLSIGPLGRMTDTLILGEGRNQWLRMIARGAGYVMISVRRASGTVKPDFRFISAISSMGADSCFLCADDLLNSGWNRAMDSLIPCVSQNIIDDPCAKRCQTLPESFIYSRILYNLPGGRCIPEKAIREFAESQLETGMMLKTVPSGIYSYSPDASLIWILWLEDHWMNTGDLDFIASMEPCLSRLLFFFRLLSPEGHAVLQSERAGHCVFLNKNRDLEERNVFTMLNALYYRALNAAFRLYSALKMKDRAIQCEQLAAVLSEEVISLTRSLRSGIFADSYLEGKRSDNSSVYTNLMVLNSGLVKNEGEISNLLKFCCRNQQSLLNDCDSPFLFFILETLFNHRQDQFAFQLLRMALDRSLDKPCIYALGGNPHITGITAAGFLIRRILGIRPFRPGGSQIVFSPACNLLASAQCRLPVGSGMMAVSWSVDGRTLRADIASDIPVEIRPVIPSGFEAAVDINKYITFIS